MTTTDAYLFWIMFEGENCRIYEHTPCTYPQHYEPISCWRLVQIQDFSWVKHLQQLNKFTSYLHAYCLHVFLFFFNHLLLISYGIITTLAPRHSFLH